MVYVGAPFKNRRKRGGRPTRFDTLLEMAKVSWAPVLECLSLIDSKKFKYIEDIPPPPDNFSIDLGERIIAEEKRSRRKQIRWISPEQIKIVHDDLIQTFGGAQGIADVSHLDSIVDRIKNSNFYGYDPLDTTIHKAAFIMHNLLRYHQFVDGQKRTGLSSAFIFLGLNGYTMWSRNVLKEVHYCIETTQGEHDISDITEWLSNRILDLSKVKHETIIDAILKHPSGVHARCTNQECRGAIALKAYRTRCPKCGRLYELRIANAVVTHGLNPYVTFNIGLHKLEDMPIVKTGIVTLDQFN
jgi:death-on-curing protein